MSSLKYFTPLRCEVFKWCNKVFFAFTTLF